MGPQILRRCLARVLIKGGEFSTPEPPRQGVRYDVARERVTRDSHACPAEVALSPDEGRRDQLPDLACNDLYGGGRAVHQGRVENELDVLIPEVSTGNT